MDNRKPLTYGYIIALSPFNSSNSFIMSDGFIKNNPCIREIHPQNGSGSLHDRCLFSIYPSFNTQYIEKALKTVEEQRQQNPSQTGTQRFPSGQDNDENIDNDMNSNNDLDVQKDVSQLLPQQQQQTTEEQKSTTMLQSSQHKQMSKKKIEEKKKQFESKVVNEYKHNLELFEKQKGQPINFDKPIQLLHVASNKFLACNYIEAELEKENFKLDLQEFSSKNTHFKLQPSFSHQKRSDNIVEITDVVFMTSAKMYLGKVPYLNSSQEGKMKGVKNKSELLERNYDYIQQRDKMIQKYKEDTSKGLPAKSSFLQIPNIESAGNFTLEDEGFTIDLRDPLDYKTKEGIELQQQQQLFQDHKMPNIKDFIIPDKINMGGTYIQQNLISKNIVAKNITDIKQREQTLRKEANVSLESRTKWKIQPYSEYIEDENVLCFGQVIWLHHIESQSTIVIQKGGQEGLTINMEGTTIRDQQFQKYEGNTNGMWIIENQEFTKGGPVEWDKPVYFRNLSLGKYLAIKEEKYGNQDIIQFTTLDNPDQRAIFSFSMMPYALSSNQNSKIIMKDSFFYIKSHYKTHGGYIHLKEDAKMGQSLNFIEEQNEDLAQESAKINILDQATDEDSFKLFRATMTEVLEQSFLISCFPVIKNNLDTFNRLYELQYGKDYKKLLEELDKNKVEKKMKTLKGCLQDLEKFVNNKLIITSIDQQRNYGKPNRLRQKVLFEQDYIQNLVHLLRFMTKAQELHELNKLQKEQEKYQKLKNMEQQAQNMIPFSENCKAILRKIKSVLKKKKGLELNLRQNVQILNLMSDVDQRKKNRVINYFKSKVSLIKLIYSLLQSICKENEDNQKKVEQLFYHFQYQTKYIPEAVNFIISIVSQNEIILGNLCDDLKILEKSKKKKLHKQMKLNKQYELKDQIDQDDDEEDFYYSDNEDNQQQKSQLIQQSQQPNMPDRVLQSVKPEDLQNMVLNTDLSADSENLIMFFMKQTEDNQSVFQNMNFLRLFRSICKFKNKGISVNQEQIFNLFKHRPIFKQSLLFNIKVIKSKLQITHSKGRIEYLESMKVDKDDEIDPDTSEGYTLTYLIEQIKFYSDLALSRNFLWKNELDNIFPILYVVGKIFAENLHTTIRSAFCNLALTQYIDHEPFNQMVLPNKCRIHFSKYDTDKNHNLFEKIQENIEGINNEEHDAKDGMKDVFQKLITNSQIYFNKEISLVDTDFIEQKKKLEKSKEKNYNSGPDILNNHLTYDIIRMLGTLLQFGIIDIQNTQLYSQFIILLVRLLEYDYQVPSISIALKEVRKQNFEKNKTLQTQNKILKGFKGIFKDLVSGIGDVVGLVVDLADYTVQKLGILQKRKEDIEQELAEYSSSYHSKNPLIGGLISLTSMLKNKHQTLNSSQDNNNEVMIKLEICDQLIFMQKLRINFLISNFICWFDSKGNKYRYMDYNDENWRKKFESDIEDDLHSVIPDIFKTGILEVDQKYMFKTKNIMNLSLFNSEDEEKLLKKAKPKKFNNFTSSHSNYGAGSNSNRDNLRDDDDNLQNQQKGNKKKKNKSNESNNNNNKQFHYLDNSKKSSQKMKKSQQNFIPDLDTLLSGPDNHKEIKSELLPSLLTSFFLVNNSELEDKILEVIFKCFMQTTELFQYLHEIEVLFDEKDVFPYLSFQKKIQDLRLLAEKSEVWLSEFHENMQRKPSNADISRTIKLLEDIRNLFYQNSQVAVNGDIELSDSDKVDKTRQKIFTFLNGHQTLINLVKEAQNQMAKILKQDDISPGAKKTIYTLLRNLYKCLQIFCQGAEENQNILYDNIPHFLDEIQHDFGQFDLIVSIFEDNKFLCENIKESLIKTLLNTIKDQGRQERFLRLFKVIMQRRDKQGEYLYIVENQIKVFKWFIPSFYQDKSEMIRAEHLIYGHVDKNKKQFFFNFNLIDYDSDEIMMRSHSSNSSYGSYNRDQPFFYHSALLDIFMIGISGDEGLNLNGQKVKNILPLGYLLEDILCKPDGLNEHGLPSHERRSSIAVMHDRRDMYKILREEDGYSVIKPKVLEFILSVYLNLDKPIVDIILKYSESWIKLFEFEAERIKECSSLTDRYRTYLNTILSNMFYIYAVKITSQFEDLSEIPGYEALHKFIDVLVKKIDLIQTHISFLEYENVKKLIKLIDPDLYELNKQNIEKAIRNVDHSNTSSNLQKMISKLSQNSNPKIQPQRSIKNVAGGSQVTALTNNLGGGNQNLQLHQDIEFQLIKEEENQEDEDDQWLSQKSWKNLLNLVNNSNALKQAKKNQFSALGEAITNIEKMISDDIIKEYNFKLDHKELMKKMIQYLYSGIANKVNIQNMQYMLQVLIGILENAEEDDKLEEMQNLIDSIDGTKMFLHLVSDSKQHPFDEEFFMVLLDFMIKMLENGNPKIQQSIYDYFMIYPQSEVFFSKIYQIFSDYIDFLKEIKKKQEKGIYITNDQEQNQLSDLVIRILQMLQLFCEGHNLQLQNYLYKQTNSRNNQDMVTIVVDLLYQYHQSLTKNNFENIVKCLDTLIEFIQGPCPKNQETIIDSKFFEIAQPLLLLDGTQNKQTDSQDSNNPQMKKRRSLLQQKLTKSGMARSQSAGAYQQQSQHTVEIDTWQIERLKYKTMILVTSLLELNSSPQVIKRIMRSLPLEVLKSNLILIFKRQKALYGEKYLQECLKHADLEDPDTFKESQKLDKKKSAKKKSRELQKVTQKNELILETGFFIYFLIMYYLDLDSNDIDGETSSQLDEIKELEKNQFIQGFKDNIVGQLVTLLWDIFGLFFTQFKKAGNALNKAIGSKDLEKELKEQQEREKQLFVDAINFFNKNSAHIEIVRNNQIEKVHFILMPFCSYLPKETKVNFNSIVNRDSIHSKIEGLVNEAENIIEVCKHEQSLANFFERNKIVAIFAKYVNLWKAIAFLLTILLNIFILMGYDDQLGSRTERPIIYGLTEGQTDQVFQTSGIIMIVCSTFVVLFFILKNGPIYSKQAWEQNKQYLGQNCGRVQKIIRYIIVLFICFLKVLLQVEVLYYLCYGAFAFIATLQHYFFFSFHLTEFIIRYPTLRNILKSAWLPKVQLLLTFLLILLFTYFFSVTAYISFHDSYDSRCDTLYLCVFESFDRTFKSDGGLGGWLEDNKGKDARDYDIGRFFFDNIANIVIVILLVEIFSGIIIDKFSNLRQIETKKNHDIQEFCFICGHTRELFERKSDSGFESHVKNDHNLWNYIFYLAFLFDKDKNEYTGVEQYVFEKYQEKDNSYFPVQKSLVIDDQEIQGEDHNIKLIQQEANNLKDNLISLSENSTSLAMKINIRKMENKLRKMQ